LDKFNANHAAIKKGIARQAIKCVKGDYKNISFDHIESIIELASEGHTGSVLQLPGGLTVSRSYGTLLFFIGEISSDKKIQASENELCSLKDKIETEVINIDSYKYESKFQDKAFEQFFDYESLKRGITIRYRCKGDNFKPYKSNGTRKLKEFFIDEKIPRELREKIPLIADGNEIVWIIGYKTSDKYKVNEQTKQVLRIKYNLGGQNAK
jgi:tRNA(Ile)-lysidine synthase